MSLISFGTFSSMMNQGTDFKNARDISKMIEGVEREYTEALKNPDLDQGTLMQKQIKYQRAQLSIQSFQQMLQNRFQMLRSIVQNGLSIR